MSQPDTPEQRRRLREALERKDQDAYEQAEQARVRAEEHSLEASDRPQNEMSTRAKSSGHRKKTADKWNQ